MTPIGAGHEMKEGSSDREKRRFRTTCQACRDVSHRLKSRQLHKAGIGRLCSIQLDSQEYVMFDDRSDCYDFGVSGAPPTREAAAVRLRQHL